MPELDYLLKHKAEPPRGLSGDFSGKLNDKNETGGEPLEVHAENNLKGGGKKEKGKRGAKVIFLRGLLEKGAAQELSTNVELRRGGSTNSGGKKGKEKLRASGGKV